MPERSEQKTSFRYSPFGPPNRYELPLSFHLKNITHIDTIVGRLTEREIAEIHAYIFPNGKPIPTPGQNDLAFIDTLMSAAGDHGAKKPDTSETVPTLESLQEPLKQAAEIRAFLYETILGPEPKPTPKPKEIPSQRELQALLKAVPSHAIQAAWDALLRQRDLNLDQAVAVLKDHARQPDPQQPNTQQEVPPKIGTVLQLRSLIRFTLLGLRAAEAQHRNKSTSF